jgi:hypothetical protein
MYKADPYYLKGYTDRKDHGEAFRSALKLVFNAAINVDADSIRKVSFALREKMKEELKKDPSKAKFTKEEAQAINKVRGKMIRELLYKKHKPLEDHFFDERLGMVVMNQESRIVLRVLRECVNKKEPILSIFDSFIAKDTTENRTWLSETIINCYTQEFGHRFTGFLTIK